MHVHLNINYLGVVAAVVASFFFGWLWHGPLFGKKWAQLMKLPTDMKPDPKEMMKSMGLNIIGTFLMAHSIACIIQLSRPSTWGVGQDGHLCKYAICAAFSAWIGFKIPMLLNSVAWEGRSWKLFGLNAVYALLNLELIGFVICLFG